MNAAPSYEALARILVVDDDNGLREQITAYLTEQGYLVDQARDAREMDEALAANAPDLVVLDIMLPGEGGLSICRRLRGPEAPSILMLSAMGEDVDRIVGLEIGADDYLAKPCAPRELLARVRAVLRSKSKGAAQSSQALYGYLFHGFRLDVLQRQLHGPNEVLVLLTPGEYTLLHAFLDRPNRVLSRDELLDMVRGDASDVFDRAIDVQVSRLRRKLNACSGREFVRTFRGAGYLFDAAVSRL